MPQYDLGEHLMRAVLRNFHAMALGC
jgi:hypothetical protein